MDPYSLRLLEACEKTLHRWLEARFSAIVESQHLSGSVDIDRRNEVITRAARAALTELERLFETDVLQQTTNPLAIMRQSTSPVTDELARIGARPVERDEFNQRSFPADHFDLSPATWADVDEALVEPGLEWGAFKAASVIQRRREAATDR